MCVCIIPFCYLLSRCNHWSNCVVVYRKDILGMGMCIAIELLLIFLKSTVTCVISFWKVFCGQLNRSSGHLITIWGRWSQQMMSTLNWESLECIGHCAWCWCDKDIFERMATHRKCCVDSNEDKHPLWPQPIRNHCLNGERDDASAIRKFMMRVFAKVFIQNIISRICQDDIQAHARLLFIRTWILRSRSAQPHCLTAAQPLDTQSH